MATTQQSTDTPEALLDYWKKLGQLCFHLVGIYEGVIMSLKGSGIAIPADFVANMRAAAAGMQAQLLVGAASVPTLSMAAPPKLERPPGYPTEEELVRRVEEKLREKSRRPADLADLLNVPKDFIEHVLTAYENLFTRRAERGWWGVKPT